MTHHLIAGHELTAEQKAKIVELKKDTSDAGKEVLQNYIIDVMLGLHSEVGPTPTPTPTPTPGEPTLPKDGRPQPEKNANKDAKLWKVVSMKDDPTKFKVVDDKNINVADLFISQATAQQFIDYHKWKQAQPAPTPEPTPSPTPNPEPTPAPAGSSTTKDGVVVPFKVKGEWKYNFTKDARDGGARYNGPAAGTSLVMVGYFTATSGSDDVAAKLLGGTHTEPPREYEGCCYDPAIKVDTGAVRMRCECPHPTYSANIPLDFSKQGIGFHGKYVGVMAVAKQEVTGVRIQLYQDQGDNSTKPANQWVKLIDHINKGPIPGLAGGNRFPIRQLVSSAQNTFRIDETPGLNAKWLAIAEIDVSG